MQVNAFFLKFILWIPPLNPLNTLRLLVLFLAALPTAKEYYAFCDESSNTQCAPPLYFGAFHTLIQSVLNLLWGSSI